MWAIDFGPIPQEHWGQVLRSRDPGAPHWPHHLKSTSRGFWLRCKCGRGVGGEDYAMHEVFALFEQHVREERVILEREYTAAQLELAYESDFRASP